MNFPGAFAERLTQAVHIRTGVGPCGQGALLATAGAASVASGSLIGARFGAPMLPERLLGVPADAALASAAYLFAQLCTARWNPATSNLWLAPQWRVVANTYLSFCALFAFVFEFASWPPLGVERASLVFGVGALTLSLILRSGAARFEARDQADLASGRLPAPRMREGLGALCLGGAAPAFLSAVSAVFLCVRGLPFSDFVCLCVGSAFFSMGCAACCCIPRAPRPDRMDVRAHDRELTSA